MSNVRAPPPDKLGGPKDVYLGVRIPKALDKALEAYVKTNGLASTSAAVIHLLGWALGMREAPQESPR